MYAKESAFPTDDEFEEEQKIAREYRENKYYI